MSKYYVGIDPSTSSTGYAVLDEKGTPVTYGRIEGVADDPASFQNLYQELWKLLAEYEPAGIYCETQFIGINKSTGIKLIRPTGVILAVVGLFPEATFSFIAPSSWRKYYHTGTEWEKMYTKQNSYKVSKRRYDIPFKSFNKDNDISDALGIAYACREELIEEGILHESK